MLESARGLTCALTKILLYVPLHHPARSATWCVQSPTLTLTYPFGINPICDLFVHPYPSCNPYINSAPSLSTLDLTLLTADQLVRRFRVLDECDEMLNMGFVEDVEKILGAGSVPAGVQTLLFSATLPAWVKDITARFLRSDHRVIDLVGNQRMKVRDDGQPHISSSGTLSGPMVATSKMRQMLDAYLLPLQRCSLGTLFQCRWHEPSMKCVPCSAERRGCGVAHGASVPPPSMHQTGFCDGRRRRACSTWCCPATGASATRWCRTWCAAMAPAAGPSCSRRPSGTPMTWSPPSATASVPSTATSRRFDAATDCPLGGLLHSAASLLAHRNVVTAQEATPCGGFLLRRVRPANSAA